MMLEVDTQQCRYLPGGRLARYLAPTGPLVVSASLKHPNRRRSHIVISNPRHTGIVCLAGMAEVFG
jgi:hypothetical protein